MKEKYSTDFPKKKDTSEFPTEPMSIVVVGRQYDLMCREVGIPGSEFVHKLALTLVYIF